MSRHSARTYRYRQLRARYLERFTVCWLCAQPGADSVDHIRPVSQGGDPEDPANWRPAHMTCNRKRGTKPVVMTSRRW